MRRKIEHTRIEEFKIGELVFMLPEVTLIVDSFDYENKEILCYVYGTKREKTLSNYPPQCLHHYKHIRNYFQSY